MLNHPVLDCGEFFFLQGSQQGIQIDISNINQDGRTDRTCSGISLALVDKTAPVGLVTLDKLGKHLVFILNTLVSKNGLQASEELTLELSCLLWFDPEIHNRTTGVERFNDLVDEVTGEDEAAVAVELLYGGPEGQLNVVGGVVCLINDDDLVGRPRGQRDGRSELTDTVSDRIKEPPLVRTVNDDVGRPDLST